MWAALRASMLCWLVASGGCSQTATESIATSTEAGGVVFVATTNPEALKAEVITVAERDLDGIMRRNEAYLHAFADAGADARDEDLQFDMMDRARQTLILQSSAPIGQRALPAPAGLVTSIIDAYNRHHELVLRPDDIWQAIIMQFSFYVNANTEELRESFVDFKGQKTLVVEMPGRFRSADFATFANRMVDENIVRHVKDPAVAQWLIPDFSTTTPMDRVAASVTVMSTLQTYFKYVAGFLCGIPKVTLLGTPEDWQALRLKIDRLPSYDLASQRMTAWHALLAPVLDQFVLAAQGQPDITFWDHVCRHVGEMCGDNRMTGWVTVFAVFSHEGEWRGDVDTAEGRSWPTIDTDHLPVGVVSVPVLVDDNGIQYETKMFAGQFAYEAVGDGRTALRPRTDWCIAYEGKAKAQPESYAHAEIHESL